jgi:SagB-type dehydrogenase family enzyme
MSTAVSLQTETILLPEPHLPVTATLAEAFRNRRSTRSLRADVLSLPTLSALLWVAFGVNRRESDGRTAPSAHNWQEIDVYAVLPQGAYRYDPRGHRLLLVKAQDLRDLTGKQNFVDHAPLNLVYVADFARMPDARPEDREFLVGADAGCIAQNVYLYCAATGLATVVRGLIDRRQLAAALGLSNSQRVALAQSVGLPG